MSSVCANLPASRQRGVALVSVLLVFALAALLAMQLQRASTQDVKQMTAYTASAQARWYARGGEALGRQLLARDWQADERQGEHSDGVTDDWFKLLDFAIEDGEITIKVNDLSGLLNLNSVQWDGAAANDVGRLFLQLGLPPVAVGKLQQFYREPQADGRRPQLLHLEQLQELAGLNLEQVQLLRPFFSVLPLPPAADATPVINLNTVSGELLLLLGMDRSEVNSITRRQKYKKYRANELPRGSFPAAISSNIEVYSEYFEILVAASHAGRNAYLRSVVYRDSAGKLTVLQRTSAKSAVSGLLKQRGWL